MCIGKFVLYREIPHFKRWYQLEKVIDSHLSFPPSFNEVKKNFILKT